MADDIGTITFTDVKLSNGSGVSGHFDPTTITINYTTGAVTGHVIFHADGKTYHFTSLI